MVGHFYGTSKPQSCSHSQGDQSLVTIWLSFQAFFPNFQLAQQGLCSTQDKSCHQQSLLTVLGQKGGIQIVHTELVPTRIPVMTGIENPTKIHSSKKLFVRKIHIRIRCQNNQLY